MYVRLPSFVLGFHGTDKATVERVLNDPSGRLDPSTNDYDWLGTGVYFWENDPIRALEFSRARMKFKGIEDREPAVIGAVIDLGTCLNLFDQAGLIELRRTYAWVMRDFDRLGLSLPKNSGAAGEGWERRLDCLIINELHDHRALGTRLDRARLPPYQTVRAGFHEGGPLFEGAGLRAKNHIQIAVCDASCIKGYFLPRHLGDTPTAASGRPDSNATPSDR